MKFSKILALFILCTIAKGWVAYFQPILLSIGAALMALDPGIEIPVDLPSMPHWPTPDKKKRKEKDENEYPWDIPPSPSINKPNEMAKKQKKKKEEEEDKRWEPMTPEL